MPEAKIEDPGPLDESIEDERRFQIETTNRLRAKAGLPPLPAAK